MAEVFVGSRQDFEAQARKVVVAGGLEVGVFRLGEEFFAYENHCAHAGGPVCQGRILNRVEEVLEPDKTVRGFRFSPTQVNIVCPWHGYEYDIRTGQHQGNANVRLKPVPVRVRGDAVFVEV